MCTYVGPPCRCLHLLGADARGRRDREGGWVAAIIHAVDLSQRAEKDNWANVPCLVLTRNLHSPKHGLLPPHWNEEGCPTLSKNLIYQLKGCKTTKANSK